MDALRSTMEPLSTPNDPMAQNSYDVVVSEGTGMAHEIFEAYCIMVFYDTWDTKHFRLI